MSYRSFRSSKGFITFVVSFAIFTDTLLQNLLVPVLPYALHSVTGLEEGPEIQKWVSILSSAFSGAFTLGSCMLYHPVTTVLLAKISSYSGFWLPR